MSLARQTKLFAKEESGVILLGDYSTFSFFIFVQREDFGYLFSMNQRKHYGYTNFIYYNIPCNGKALFNASIVELLLVFANTPRGDAKLIDIAIMQYRDNLFCSCNFVYRRESRLGF